MPICRAPYSSSYRGPRAVRHALSALSCYIVVKQIAPRRPAPLTSSRTTSCCYLTGHATVVHVGPPRVSRLESPSSRSIAQAARGVATAPRGAEEGALLPVCTTTWSSAESEGSYAPGLAILLVAHISVGLYSGCESFYWHGASRNRSGRGVLRMSGKITWTLSAL